MASKTWNGSSGDWNVGADWSPSGVPGSLDTAVFGGTGTYIVNIGSAANGVTIPETETVAAVSLHDAGAILLIANYGTLGITSTLDLAAGTIDLVGILAGGTIIEDGGALIGDRGTLNGVSIVGQLNLGTMSSQAFYIENGLTLLGAGGTGPGSLSVGAPFEQLSFLGAQTLANAQVSISGIADRISVGTLALAATTTLVASGLNTSLYGGGLYSATTALTNAGTIIVSGTTGALAIDTTSFTNDGLVTVGTGDTLSFGSRLRSIGGTGSFTLAAGSTLVLGGSVTTAGLIAEIGSILGNQPGVKLEIGGTIDNTGGTLDFGSGALAGALFDADVIGGTVMAGGTIVGGTLDGVTYVGVLALAGSLTTLGVADGLTVLPSAGGLGTIAMTGNSDSIMLTNTPTLDNVVLEVSGLADGIFDINDSTLTLGENFSADIAGTGFGAIGASDTLFNYGTIDATANGALFQFDTSTLFNGGVVEAGSQASAQLHHDSRAGTPQSISMPSLAYGFLVGLVVGSQVEPPLPPFVLQGITIFDEPYRPEVLDIIDIPPRSQDLGDSTHAVAESGSAADLSIGAFLFGPTTGVEVGSILQTGQIPALFAQFTNMPAGIVFGGTLDNSNATLDVTATGSLSTVVIAGTVQGGTILEDGGVLGFEQSSRLDDVTLVGSLDVSVVPDTTVLLSGATLISAGGAPALIAIDGTQDAVTIFGQTLAQTLSNTQIELGIGAGATGDVLGQVGGTIEIGTGVTLTAAGTSSIFLNASNGYNATTGDATLTNAGVISDTGLLTIATYDGAGRASFVNTGLIALNPGTASSGLTLGGSFTNAGTIAVTGTEIVQVSGTAFVNTGLIRLGGGGGLAFASGSTAAGTIDLLDGAESVIVQRGGSLAATLLDFSAGDTIDFLALPPTGVVPGFAFAGGVLDIFQGSSQVAALTLPSHAYTQADFALVSDRHGGTMLATDVPCFVTGTRLRTPDGEVAVEHLAAGREVVTASGARRCVTWIGHRRVGCARHPRPALVWPVRVAAGAFGEGMPMRDLWLSPDHAVFRDGVLIPVKHLVNGRSIAQIPVDDVEYWHVELARHDILLAEGLPAESYLDTGNRRAFENGAGPISLHPDFAAQSWDDACAPLVQGGPGVAALKEKLFRRAGIAESKPAFALHMRTAQHDIAPDEVSPGVWRYPVPARTRGLTLRSPAWVPSAHYAGSLDQRRLGVRIFALSRDDHPVDLDDPVFAAGFHAVEDTAEGRCRWTDGQARLALPPRTGSVTLTVGDDAVASLGAPACRPGGRHSLSVNQWA